MSEQSRASPEHASSRSDSPNAKDMEGVALLRQVFPELSLVELHKLHTDHLRKSARIRQAFVSPQEHQQPTSTLGQRIWKQSKWLEEHVSNEEEEELPVSWRPLELPDGFLQLPPSLAIRRFNDKNDKWYYLLVNRLEEQVLEQHLAHQDFSGAPVDLSASEGCHSKIIHRDVQSGLGMTLCEDGGRVWIHSLLGRDGSRWFVAPPASEEGGPAMTAGVVPGDWLLGINGQALLSLPSGHKTLLHDAVSVIHYSADPIVLHLRRVPADKWHVNKNEMEQVVSLNSPSLLDMTTLSIETMSDEESKATDTPAPPAPIVHPFVLKLDAKGLMKGIEGMHKKN